MLLSLPVDDDRDSETIEDDGGSEIHLCDLALVSSMDDIQDVSSSSSRSDGKVGMVSPRCGRLTAVPSASTDLVDSEMGSRPKARSSLLATIRSGLKKKSGSPS